MRKLEINLTENQYQKMNRIIRNSNSDHLNEGVFGGYELCLSIGVLDVFPTNLELKTNKSIDLGEVEWKFSKMEL